MATLGQWDSGTLPTTVGSGVSSAPTGGWSGGPAIQFDQQTGDISQVRFQFAAGQSVAVRAYLRMPASWAASSMALIIARPNSTSNVAQVTIAGTGAPGQVRFLKADPSANATSPSSNGTIEPSTWYRFEMQLDQAAGQGRMAAFPLGSDTAIYSTGWVSNDFGDSTYRVEVGPAYTSTTVGMVRAANIMVTDDLSGWIGRAAGDTLGSEPSGNILGQWDSGALPTVMGSGVSYVSNGGWDGRPAIQFSQPEGVISQVRFQFSAATSLALRAYVQMPTTWSSSGQPIIVARPNGIDMSGRMTLAGTAAPGQVRLTDTTGGVTAASSSNGTVSASQWYRFELQFNGASGQARTAVFALGSDTPLWSSGWVTNDFTMPAIYAEFGPGWGGTTLPQIRMTNLLVTDDVNAWIGRAAGDDGSPSAPQTTWRILTAGGWVPAFAHEVEE